MNDISLSTDHFHVITYADDTTLTTTIQKFQTCNNNETIESGINKELYKITDWLKLNKLSLNINKTKFTIFHMKTKAINPLNIKIENINLEHADNFVFLGLNINT